MAQAGLVATMCEGVPVMCDSHAVCFEGFFRAGAWFGGVARVWRQLAVRVVTSCVPVACAQGLPSLCLYQL